MSTIDTIQDFVCALEDSLTGAIDTNETGTTFVSRGHPYTGKGILDVTLVAGVWEMEVFTNSSRKESVIRCQTKNATLAISHAAQFVYLLGSVSK